MVEPYYSDDLVTPYHGDCRDVLTDLSERLSSPEMVEAVAWVIGAQQAASRVEYKKRVGHNGRVSIARAVLDEVCARLGVPASPDLIGPVTPLAGGDGRG